MVKYLSIIFISVLMGACTESEKASTNVVTQLPPLHIQPEVYDLGDIKEGEAAIATFLIRNNSTESIQLVDIQASCGCTAAEPDSYVIMPNSFTQLKVAVDTTAKQNDIKKSVHITDSLGNKTSATLEFNVVENPHLAAQGKTKGIFDGKCASCHFEPLLGKKIGAEIYEVGCAMCHGTDADGAYAMGLRDFSSLAALKHGIAHGSGRAQMPGFAEINGGPLTFEQIEVLADWLHSLPEK